MRSRALWFGTLLGVALVMPALADQTVKIAGRPTIVVPTASTLAFAQFDTANTAQFRGTALMNGTYHITHTPPFATEDMSGGGVSIRFSPDKNDVAKLPYWSGTKASTILFDNPADILEVLPPTTDPLGSHLGKTVTVSGHIAIKVTDYRMTMECGGVHYRAHFLALAAKPQQIAKNDTPENEGC